MVSFDGDPPIHLRFEQLAQRDLLAELIRNLDADGRLSRNPIDEDRFRLHGETEIVGQAGDLRVFDARVRLELERGDDRTRMNLDHRPFDRELAAFLFEQASAIHQLAFVDLAFGLRRVEERQRRQGVVALPAFRGRLRDRLRIGEWQWRRRHAHLWRARRLCANAAEDGRRERPLLVDLWRLRRLFSFHRRGHRWRLDFRRHAALLRVLGDHFATLLLTPPLFAPFAKRFEQREGLRPCLP